MKKIGELISFIGDLISGKRQIKLVTTEIVIIYGLRGIDRKQYFYVGKTKISNFEHRLRTHIQESKTNTHKNKALATIIRRMNFMITMDILETCSDYESPHKEAYFIEYLKHKKHPLVNIRNPLNPYQDLIKPQ